MSKFQLLAIETSCDDTSVAVVNSDYEVLANLTSAQEIHNLYGGVVPELASRMHIKYIMQLTEKVFKESNIELGDIDGVAIAINPGLIGSLLVGVSYAKGLAYAINKPLIAVNHMIAHIYANKITHPELKPPFLALVVSGGHSELVLFETEQKFTVIGKTVDDAAGEAFDKTAKLLGLGYPGGPIIDKLAVNGDPAFVEFPRALKQSNNFSFSGLKTSILNYVQKQDEAYIQKHIADIAASVQEAIVDSLLTKTMNYAVKFKINQIVLAGGVSANSRLRKRFTELCDKHKIELVYPPLKYCMDNAAMVGAAAIDKYRREEFASLELNPFSTKGIRLI